MLLGQAGLLALTALCYAAEISVTGRVVDDNGVAVAGARVELSGLHAVSDTSGQFGFQLASAGDFVLQAQREGFFRYRGTVNLREGGNQLIITLNHLQEFAESVEVVYSPPAIDPAEPAERKQLNSVEILAVPYPAPHDFRNALPLFQGVVQDTAGRPHFHGGATDQTNYTLDGFNIADPVTGRFEARLSIESVRSLDLEVSRFSPEKGRGSAGSLDIKTKMGDDRWRFGGTNFVPSISTDGGLHLNKWTPRLELSGPIARSRAWFHNGFDAFYDVDTIDGLPASQNRRRSLTTSNLTHFQVNLTPANLLIGSFLLNFFDSDRHGLSFLDPIETTTSKRHALYMATLKDQVYLGRGALLEIGYAESRRSVREVPQGRSPFQISPFGRRGNYFVHLDSHRYRRQWIANAFLPSFQLAGAHQLKLGLDFERESFHQKLDRHDYRVLRTDYSVARHVSFAGDPFQRRANFEGAHYVVDRWTPHEGLLVEAGLRVDWDQIVRQALWSPRISAAWAPPWLGDTKLAAGYGVFHDNLSLGTLTLHQDQVAYSTFYSLEGWERGPVPTAFLVDEDDLHAPRYHALSFTVERKLPWDLYGRAGYTRRTGRRGFTFVNDPEPSYYRLRNWRNDRYDGLELAVRRTFGRFEWSAGYTRSSARTDAVVDYSLDNPVFAAQAPGPFAWDTPHRFLMWGWAPVSKRLLPRALQFLVRDTDVAYLVEFRTGFPFSVVNEEGHMVGPPNGRRFPSYFNVNLHFERKFRFLHYLWAWRFGFNNLTNNGNPNIVNNNIDSPGFLAYGRGQHRAFSVRLRLLGKK